MPASQQRVLLFLHLPGRCGPGSRCAPERGEGSGAGAARSTWHRQSRPGTRGLGHAHRVTVVWVGAFVQQHLHCAEAAAARSHHESGEVVLWCRSIAIGAERGGGLAEEGEGGRARPGCAALSPSRSSSHCRPLGPSPRSAPLHVPPPLPFVCHVQRPQREPENTLALARRSGRSSHLVLHRNCSRIGLDHAVNQLGVVRCDSIKERLVPCLRSRCGRHVAAPRPRDGSFPACCSARRAFDLPFANDSSGICALAVDCRARQANPLAAACPIRPQPPLRQVPSALGRRAGG